MPKYIAGTVCRKKSDRPKKPYKGFPLFPHALGYWSAKINGSMVSFGRWGRIRGGEMVIEPYAEGWQEALKAWEARYGDAKAGRVKGVVKPKPRDAEGLSLKTLCLKYLKAKDSKVAAGDLTRAYWLDQKKICERLCDFFGDERLVDELGPEEFLGFWDTLQKGKRNPEKFNSPIRIQTEIVRVKSIMKFAVENHLVEGPIRYGSEFKGPDQRKVKGYKNKRAKKFFEAEEIRALLVAADPTMRVAILLGINAAVGNLDIANLQKSHVDFKRKRLVYPRGKTEVKRVTPLWDETIDAIKVAIEKRPKPADKDADASTVLLTPRGERLVRMGETCRTDGIQARFRLLMKSCKIEKGLGVGFYSLRNTADTVGLRTTDRDAVKLLMGHEFGEMIDSYDQEGPSLDRLQRVVDYIHNWLFPTAEGGAL